MEELVENFSKHINKLISNKLGTKIRGLARSTPSLRTEEDYSRMENNIQALVESYLFNLKDNEYKEIANNIFNSFVEEDDKNLINAINFYKRTYIHYEEMNLRKKFFRWRKTSLKLKIINNLVDQKCNNAKSDKKKNKNFIPIDKYKEEKEADEQNVDEEIINEAGNVEDYIATNNKNKNKYHFNYQNMYNEGGDDYKEESNEELDMNKLYLKKNNY